MYKDLSENCITIKGYKANDAQDIKTLHVGKFIQSNWKTSCIQKCQVDSVYSKNLNTGQLDTKLFKCKEFEWYQFVNNRHCGMV